MKKKERGYIMEQTKQQQTAQVELILEEARKLFDGRRYAGALTQYEQAAALIPECLEVRLSIPACRFLSGLQTGDRLDALWMELRPMLEEVIAGNDANNVLSSIQEIRRVISICTAATYRSGNERQMLEYAALNQEVQIDKKAPIFDEVKQKLDQKEHVFDEIQRILLEADVHYRSILRVMFDFAQLVCTVPNQEQAEEEFFLNVFSYMTSAVELIDESALEKEFAPLQMAEYACHMTPSGQMQQAIDERNKLLQLTLKGSAALEKWDFFAPYAEAAGIERTTLEKKVRRQQQLEKLKFWKKFKK
jgi:hypothetical protein